MSVYSGFGTRRQETAYNQTLEKLVFLLQKRIVKHLNQEPIDEERFQLYFSKLYAHLAKMEDSKYLPPKFSECAQELAQIYGLLDNNLFQEQSLASMQPLHGYTINEENSLATNSKDSKDSHSAILDQQQIKKFYAPVKGRNSSSNSNSNNNINKNSVEDLSENKNNQDNGGLRNISSKAPALRVQLKRKRNISGAPTTQGLNEEGSEATQRTCNSKQRNRRLAVQSPEQAHQQRVAKEQVHNRTETESSEHKTQEAEINDSSTDLTCDYRQSKVRQASGRVKLQPGNVIGGLRRQQQKRNSICGNNDTEEGGKSISKRSSTMQTASADKGTTTATSTLQVPTRENHINLSRLLESKDLLSLSPDGLHSTTLRQGKVATFAGAGGQSSRNRRDVTSFDSLYQFTPRKSTKYRTLMRNNYQRTLLQNVSSTETSATQEAQSLATNISSSGAHEALRQCLQQEPDTRRSGVQSPYAQNVLLVTAEKSRASKRPVQSNSPAESVRYDNSANASVIAVRAQHQHVRQQSANSGTHAASEVHQTRARHFVAKYLPQLHATATHLPSAAVKATQRQDIAAESSEDVQSTAACLQETQILIDEQPSRYSIRHSINQKQAARLSNKLGNPIQPTNQTQLHPFEEFQKVPSNSVLSNQVSGV